MQLAYHITYNKSGQPVDNGARTITVITVTTNPMNTIPVMMSPYCRYVEYCGRESQYRVTTSSAIIGITQMSGQVEKYTNRSIKVSISVVRMVLCFIGHILLWNVQIRNH